MEFSRVRKIPRLNQLSQLVFVGPIFVTLEVIIWKELCYRLCKIPTTTPISIFAQ